MSPAVTDVPIDHAASVPARLGTSARMDGERFTMDLVPRPEVLHHGVVRASVLAFVVDVVAGITIDDDPDAWSLTSDLSVRMRPVPASARISATTVVLRRGRRSVSCSVDLHDDAGALVAVGAAGFTKLPRRAGDPPKPTVTPAEAVAGTRASGSLDRPLREEAGIEVLDAERGIVQLRVRPELRNPNGTLQGAMVALVAEAAVEDLVATRSGRPMVVTDLDLRYLGRAEDGPVRSACRVLGDDPGAPVEVTLTDVSADRVTTLVYARAQTIGHG